MNTTTNDQETQQDWILRLLAAASTFEKAPEAIVQSSIQTTPIQRNTSNDNVTAMKEASNPVPSHYTSTPRPGHPEFHPKPRIEPRAPSASVANPSTATCDDNEDQDRHGSRTREHRYLVKDYHRFMSRLEGSRRDVERLAREAEELEAEAGKKRAGWAKEVRNLNQLEGIVGFIEARLEGLNHDASVSKPPSKGHHTNHVSEGNAKKRGSPASQSFVEPCVAYNMGWCEKGRSCPLRHVCCVCESHHHFTKSSRRQICYKWNIGKLDGCTPGADGRCRREHRCLLCASKEHVFLECRRFNDVPGNMCLVWNSCGSGRACTEGTCGRIHRCLRCSGGHAVLLCPENVEEYTEELYQGSRKQHEREKKRSRRD